MEKTTVCIVLGISLIELIVIFALKKKENLIIRKDKK